VEEERREEGWRKEESKERREDRHNLLFLHNRLKSEYYDHLRFDPFFLTDSIHSLCMCVVFPEGLNTQLQLMGCVARLSAMQHKTRRN
jgi:hypothetical protein